MTFLLLILAVMFISAALLVGISDNIPAILILFSGIVLFITAFVHIWKRIKQYLILALIFALAFPVFVVLHNVFYGVSDLYSGKILLAGAAHFMDTTTFIIAVVVCPACVIVGLVGALILYVKIRRVGPGAHQG